MFKQLTDKINYSQLELKIIQFWKENNIFDKSITAREGKPGFTFYEGPPTANGRPGIHHVMSRTLKDLICRYKTMCGFQVHRKAGWDTHGLPVEIEVEKSLKMKHKDEIVAYGIARFNEECRQSVWKYKTEWEGMTERMGYWVNLNEPYVTFENNYIESIWWALKKYFDAGLIYKGFKIQPYCPRCETPLSSHEVSLGYQDVKDPSVYVKMKLHGAENTYFLVWTTTPWTLISNVAIAVHSEVDYVLVENKGEKLILAEARLSILDGEYISLKKFKGKELAEKQYERLFNYHPLEKKAHYVLEADFVTTSDGSGIVHIAPAYGEDDYQISKKYDLPTLHPVNKSGEFGEDVTDFKNMFVKDADKLIIENLKARKILYKKETITHSYPHCWRCKTPLLYYARDSWYIATTQYAQKMIALNTTINWVPKEVGVGRFGNWLEENKDWALSRDRFWGTPLPIWVCDSCGEKECIGSVAELKLRVPNLSSQLDLHKPFVDEISWICSCGGTKKRTPELIDVWFDSGAMPFAQWHYPFENKDIFESQHPADFISEGIDQTRGWFYSLHSISTFLFDKPAYKNLIVNELVLDKDGQKMSKSKGNTVNPFEVLEKFGADATRWYLVATSPPWRPTMFDEDGIVEVQRKFFGTLLNTYSFFTMYANIDGFEYDAENVLQYNLRPEIDRWIISSLHSLIVLYTEAMEAYDVTKASRAVSDFTIDQLSNWYVRRNRRRFWSKGTPNETINKQSAYQTLYECLETIAKLMAPVAPFLAEELYRNLHSSQSEVSVHLAMLPQADVALIDASLEARMNKAQRISSLVRAIRTRSNIKVRQPLQRVIIPVGNENNKISMQKMEDVILDEINVKAVEYVADDSGIVKKKAKPNFKLLGTKYGKLVPQIANKIKMFSTSEITQLERNHSIAVDLNGETVSITLEDIEVQHEDITGWLVESEGEITVALDTALTDELLQEGIAREFVNRVQNLRKDSDFEVMDRIVIRWDGSKTITTAITVFQSYIQHETLAESITVGFNSSDNGVQQFEIGGEICRIAVQRI
jgi:isoleucyl-tRNA synthetase